MPTRKRREREQEKQARLKDAADKMGRILTGAQVNQPSKLGILRGISGSDEQATIEQRLARIEADMKASDVHRLDRIGCAAMPTPQAATRPSPPPLLQRIDMLENEYRQFRDHVVGSLDEIRARIVRLEEALGL